MSVAVTPRGPRSLGILAAAAAGALFGVGLLVAGMVTPAKIVGFLDVVHGWDPSLAFVMGGAVTVYAITMRLVRRGRQAPWFDRTFHLPTRRDIDVQLLAGAALFGVGWGLGGLCPGPAIVAAASGARDAVIFVAAMLVGMVVQHRSARR